MKMKKFFCGILSLLIATSVFASQDNYNQAWKEFNNNNRKEARNFFDLAVQREPESKADAYLGLALLDWSEANDSSAFVNFRRFYESSQNPYPQLYALFSMPFMSLGSTLSDAQLAFFNEIMNDPKMNGTLKAMLDEKIGEYYINRNDFNKGKEYFAHTGALSNWQVLGDFSNISGSGFDKDWGALTKATPESVFKNSVDADVQWYQPSAIRSDLWFAFDFYFQLNNSIFYTQTFVNSPVAQEVYVRTGTSGSLKIWINDALISSIPEERNCDLDIYAYKVKLNKGVNRILVQIGQSEISRANFMMRLTDANANPIEGLTHSATYSKYTKSTAPATNDLLPFFPEEYFENKVREEPANPLNYLLLAETYLRNDKAYEGIRILKKVEQQFAPKSSFVSYRLAEAYARAQNNTDYSREIENIKLDDPDSYVALTNFYSEAIDMEKYTEAEEINAKIKKLYRENRDTEARDMQLLNLQKKIDELITYAKKMYAKYPYSYDYMSLNFSIEDNVYKNTKAATALLEEYCKQYFNTSALDVLANRYLTLGETEEGLKIYRQRIEQMPYATGFLYSYVGLLQKMQRYDDALSVLDEIKKLAPYLSGVYSTQGYIYKELKNDTKAKDNFKKAIYYAPTSYDARMQLRLLDNKKEIFDLFPQKNLNELIAKAPTAKDYPDENAVIVMEENQLVFYPEGAQEQRREIAVKILNQSGIEEWKEYGIGYNGNSQKLILNKYEVIKANGQKLKAETDNEGTVVFTNLEVGDVLHLDYRLQNYASGVFSKHICDYAVMQYNIPVMYSRYSILLPKNKKFDYVVKNARIAPQISDMEDMKLYQWEAIDQTPIKDEPYMSPLVDVATTFVFSSIPNWQFVSDWYRDMTTNKINAHSDYVFKETFAEILKGKENAAPLEKAALFYEYILQNITYSNVSFLQSNFIPQKASRTITTRLGDCKDVSTLFVALCREAGIKANLVLLDSRFNGKNSLALPSYAFNHCIAQLNLDGKIYYLELTDNKLPFGSALDYDLDSNILPIPYKNESIGSQLLVMEMPFRTKNRIEREAAISIENNDMKIQFSSIRYGQLSSFFRHLYADKGAEDRLKEVNQNVAADWSVPVKVSDLTFGNMDNLCDSVTSSYRVDAKGVLQNVAGMQIFKLPWSDGLSSLSAITLENRKYPFEFWSMIYADSQTEQFRITLPQGKHFAEIPQNVKLECTAATYELTYTTVPDGNMLVKRTFTKKQDIVAPAEYAAFQEFLTQVSENDNKQYAIK